MATSTIWICILFFVRSSQCLTPDQMFPYGPANGDLAEYRNDDGYVQINLNINFPFFGDGHDVLFVDTNGDLTFDQGLGTYTPSAFPLNDNVKIVAPFWSDVDTLNNNGLVYYRQTTDPSLLAAGSAQIKQYFPDMNTYKASWMFIATWYNVTFFGGNPSTTTNTFQCVLLTDGTYSFAIYNYLQILWTTGTASGGNSQGLGGTPAQVGFDAGDGINFYAIPQSRTADVVNVGSMSNLNPPLPGKFIFMINNQQIHNIPVVHILTCSANTDPHFTTFDGGYYSPQEPPGPQFLAAAPVTDPNGTLPWAVWFSTSYWYGNPSATCITEVEVDIEDQVVVFGMNGYLRINGLDVIAPFYYPNQENTSFTVVAYGTTGHLLNTVDQVQVSFTGDDDNTLRIQAPMETYENDMQGVCGNMDGNPNNDITCPNGQSINTCWERHAQTTTRSPPTTTTAQQSRPTIPAQTTDRPVEPTTASFGCSAAQQQQIDQQCSIITNIDGPFQVCVINATDIAENYYQSCIYDLCVNNTDPNVICYELQSYADACMQAVPTVTLQWRSQYFCPPNCSANAHYEDCAPSCPATCGNPTGPLTCPIPCRGDCICDDGYILDNGQCILQNQCGCTDSNGLYHQNGTSWVTPDCQSNCTCGDGQAITCTEMQPCADHAQCQVQGGKQNCFCSPGYTGDGTDSCNPINYCAGNPCHNGGTCTNANLTYNCHCANGYSGPACDFHYTTTVLPSTAKKLSSSSPSTRNPYLYSCTTSSQCNNEWGFCVENGPNPSYWFCACMCSGGGCLLNEDCCSNVCDNGVCATQGGTQGSLCQGTTLECPAGEQCADGYVCQPWGDYGYCDSTIATAQPTTGGPTAGQPTTGLPTSGPSTAGPTTGPPTEGLPTTGRLSTVLPTTGHPTIVGQTTGQPTIVATTHGPTTFISTTTIDVCNLDTDCGPGTCQATGAYPPAYICICPPCFAGLTCEYDNRNPSGCSNLPPNFCASGSCCSWPCNADPPSCSPDNCQNSTIATEGLM